MPSPSDTRGLSRALLAVTAALLAIRLYAAARVGFGDSEALYVTYAAHPQPAYLDHPGLVGLAAALLRGGDGVISPTRVHLVTSLVACSVPWLAVLAARSFGASRGRALVLGLAVAVTPETAVGLFALTPDLLLAPLWLGALALLGAGLASAPSSTRGSVLLLAAGLAAGVSAASKASGALLAVGIAIVLVSRARSRDEALRAPARSFFPWIGLALGAAVVLPIVEWEVRNGLPMLAHRLVRPGVPSIARGLLVLAGQLVYVSPLLLVLLVRALRALRAARADSPSGSTLWTLTVIAGAPLVLLSLASPRAEPHWIAPALLTLAVAAALLPALSPTPRFVRRALGVAGAISLAAHAWVLVPASRALAPRSADLRWDIASELFGWPEIAARVSREIRELAPAPGELALAGPHWTVCAQLAAALPKVDVGCATPGGDDFDRWLPRARWTRAQYVVWVTDNRFDDDGGKHLPLHAERSRARVEIARGGRLARVFEIVVYERRAVSVAGAIGRSPASARRERSSSSPGFGVVRSLSP